MSVLRLSLIFIVQFIIVHGLARVDDVRYFEFPQGDGAPINNGDADGGTGGGFSFDNPLVRQGFANGTIIGVPLNSTFPQVINPTVVNNQTCTCVPAGQCGGGTGNGNFGAGQIDVRIVSTGTVSKMWEANNFLKLVVTYSEGNFLRNLIQSKSFVIESKSFYNSSFYLKYNQRLKCPYSGQWDLGYGPVMARGSFSLCIYSKKNFLQYFSPLE